MGVAKMAGLRKFPQLTSSYSHTHKDTLHKEKEASHKARPSSAPSSPQTGRHLLASRQQQNKSYHKVTYPLRNRRPKANLKSQINAAPNAEYIVTGRGYTFTRHNNKLTMNIDTEVFFDDKTTPAESGLKKKPSSPKQPPNKFSLQKQLEESIQIQEKLHRALIEAAVKLEEQKLEQDNEKTNMLEKHDAAMKELTKLHQVEKRKIMKAHEEMLFNNETKHASKLADQQAATANRELLMKKDIHNLKDEIAENNSRHEVELIACLKRKEEELNAINLKALSDLKTEMTNDYKNQLSSRLKSLEKEHERTLAEKTVIHKNEIEDLISRFKDSAQIEDDFKKTSQLLKECETEMEHLIEEKKQLTIELRGCKAQLQETESELLQYKQKFQNKVDEVKEQCDTTINQLTIENTELRRRLLRKTEELSDLRMEEDKRLRGVQLNLKKSIIQARIKANLPVALGLQGKAEDDETKDRQGSAPITRQEKDSHRKRLSSVEQEQLSESTHSNRMSSRTPGHKQQGNKRQPTA